MPVSPDGKVPPGPGRKVIVRAAGWGVGVGWAAAGVHKACKVRLWLTISGAVTTALFIIHPPKLYPGRVVVGKVCIVKPG